MFLGVLATMFKEMLVVEGAPFFVVVAVVMNLTTMRVV